MTTYHSITQTPPPVGVRLLIWWWGEGEIVATFDGVRWRDEQGRIVRGPITHWRLP